MKINSIFDKSVSNLIVYASFTIIIFIWYYLFYNYGNQIDVLLFYFPYGMIISAFLFFDNRIIVGLLLSYISLLFVFKNYNLNLSFSNFFVMSASQVNCVPVKLFVLRNFNITLGTGEKYMLDKTNIYHVLLITFLSTIVLVTLVIFTSILYEHQCGYLRFINGHFFG